MTCITCGKRFGSLMMLHDRGELRTDFRRLGLTVTHHAPCQQQGSRKGIGIFVGQADDPQIGGRGTSAAFVLDSIEEVERFLVTLAR